MPLTEERRTQLDGIVQQMTQNKEPDENIQWVVNDFKQKYEPPQAMPPIQMQNIPPLTPQQEFANPPELTAPERKTVFDWGKQTAISAIPFGPTLTQTGRQEFKQSPLFPQTGLGVAKIVTENLAPIYGMDAVNYAVGELTKRYGAEQGKSKLEILAPEALKLLQYASGFAIGKGGGPKTELPQENVPITGAKPYEPPPVELGWPQFGVKGKVKQVGEIFGEAKPLTEGGKITQEMSWKNWRRFQDKAAEIKNEIPIKPDEPMWTNKLEQAAQDNIDALGKIENPTIKGLLNRVQRAATPETGGTILGTEVPVPPYTWKQLNADYSAIEKLARGTKDWNLKRIYNKLTDAMNEDIISLSKEMDNPEIVTKLDKFRDFYRMGDETTPGIKVWKNKQIERAMNTDSPSQISGTFMKPNTNIENIQRLKDVAGPEGYQPIKQAWAKNMLGGEGQFNRQVFMKQYEAYQKGGNLETMLSPDEKLAFDNLYNASKKSIQLGKIFRTGEYAGAMGTTYYALRKIFGF